jgi:hypothetical protein
VTQVTPDTLAPVLKDPAVNALEFVGDFPNVVIQNRVGLVIDGSAATFGSVQLKLCTGLSWTGGDFRGGSWAGGLNLIGCKDVGVSALRYLGAGLDAGVTVRSSARVTVHDCQIERASVGVSMLESQSVVLRGCGVFGFAIDGCDIASCTDVLVEFNVFAGGMLKDAHHPDGLQGWTRRGGTQLARITVRKNQFAGPSQGSGFFDHGTGGGDAIVIEANDYCMGYPQAIAIQSDSHAAFTNCRITDNRVRTLPGSAMWARINADPSVIRSGNVVEAYGTHAAIAEAPASG